MSFKALFEKRTPGAPLILPLRAYYAPSPKRERQRKAFLHLAGIHFGPLPPPVFVPLAENYRRSDAFEAKRARFYALMAREFAFENWTRPAVEPLKSKKPGRGGMRQDLNKGTTRNPTIRDARAGASEFLQTGTWLNDPTLILAADRDKNLALAYGDIRRRAARDYVSLVEMVAGSVLASLDWMKEGHASAGPTTVGEARLDAAQALNDIRATMPSESMLLANKVLLQDVFVWERTDAKGKDSMSMEERKAILEDLRMALDFIAFGLGFIKADRMKRRWPLARLEWILRPAVDRARRAS